MSAQPTSTQKPLLLPGIAPHLFKRRTPVHLQRTPSDGSTVTPATLKEAQAEGLSEEPSGSGTAHRNNREHKDPPGVSSKDRQGLDLVQRQCSLLPLVSGSYLRFNPSIDIFRRQWDCPGRIDTRCDELKLRQLQPSPPPNTKRGLFENILAERP
ncbi:hypothetical protein B0H11DRAFT_1900329 [Mycena galericulata]|nr:hypothetical protein B0H11DRAFT_1900329 [Mycena galericulata]